MYTVWIFFFCAEIADRQGVINGLENSSFMCVIYFLSKLVLCV